MPPPENKSRIEELKKALYSRTAPDVRTRRKLRFTDKGTDMRTSWDRPAEEGSEPVLNQGYEDHSMSFFTKLLIGSAVFCVLAVGLGAYLFWNGANLISANNIDITVSGPVSVPGGAPVSFDIDVSNKNNVPLQLADLSVEFPAGATNPADPSRELTTYRELIGDIAPGGSARKTVQAIVFGEENTQKTITVTVTYKVKGSNSLFTKDRTYDLLINSSPIALTVSSFKEITSGQEFDLKVNLASNSQETLKNVLVTSGYPFGFVFLSSDPKPLADNATWRIGDIPSGGKRTITIRGKLSGEDEDTRVFRFAAGAQSSRNQNAIGTEYMSATQEIAIKKPFISLGMSVEGDQTAQSYVGSFGQPKRIEISWFNNLPTAVSDAVITLKLSGSAYDKTQVQPDFGYFRSATDEIIWDQKTVPEFQSIGAGESGRVSFSIVPRDLSAPTRPIVNPQITVKAGVSARRTQESGVPESLSSAIDRTIKVSSSLSLSGKVVRTIGPFSNTGPIPPAAERQTTYTVVWTVDNTSSSVSGAQVTATLPPYVKWTNNTAPSDEDATFNPTTGTITWNVGSVSSYTALFGRRRELDFQISFEPSVNQIGSAQTLVNDAALTATDDFTGAGLKGTLGYLNTLFSSDPTYRDGQGTVVK